MKFANIFMSEIIYTRSARVWMSRLALFKFSCQVHFCALVKRVMFGGVTFVRIDLIDGSERKMRISTRYPNNRLIINNDHLLVIETRSHKYKHKQDERRHIAWPLSVNQVDFYANFNDEKTHFVGWFMACVDSSSVLHALCALLLIVESGHVTDTSLLIL